MFVRGWKYQNGIKHGPVPSPTVLLVIIVREKKPIEKNNNENKNAEEILNGKLRLLCTLSNIHDESS